MKKVLITGITGFIGTNLSKELVKKGYQVYGLSKYSSSRDSGINEYTKNVKMLTCDITDFHSVNKIMKSIDPDSIIHLAALSSVAGSFEMPITYTQTNLVGSMNVIHSILNLNEVKNKKFIFASSVLIYGSHNKKLISENTEIIPLSPYSLTKAAIDTYLKSIYAIYGLNTISLRFTNTYGRVFNRNFFIENTITAMLNNEKIYLGTPEIIKDYMFVSDHVDSYVGALETDNIGGEAFNIGTGKSVSNKEIVLKLADIIGYDKKNILLNQFPPNYPSRPSVANEPYIMLNVQKAEKLLNWKAKINLDDGLKTTVKLLKEKLNK